MAKILNNPIQIGVIGLRDPEDPQRIIKNVPIYAEETPQVKEQTEKTFIDVSKVFAEKFKIYMEAQDEKENNHKNDVAIDVADSSYRTGCD